MHGYRLYSVLNISLCLRKDLTCTKCHCYECLLQRNLCIQAVSTVFKCGREVELYILRQVAKENIVTSLFHMVQ